MTDSTASRPGARHDIESAAADLPAPAVDIAPTREEASERAGAAIAAALAEALSTRGTAHLALTGGSGGRAIAHALPAALAEAGIGPQDLRGVHIWFGDERFVPAGDPERNDLFAAPLAEAGVPEENIHRLAGPDAAASVLVATEALERDLALAGPAGGRFDAVHLGMGPDGHVCSLFPGHPVALTTGRDMAAVENSPKPPPQRATLTFPALHRSRLVVLLAFGQDKRDAARTGLASPDAALAPISCARGERTLWFLDEGAAPRDR
ncbi:6-phosphogluconolactonase [Actinomyces denticolens]|uniref:6-phosphogluconolactonase n=1 Tax=Actinomyces denticolens TaxID=52767 RepID=A0ABY1I5T6_9ACTO|nr:6-phosphogluconolactonase [Actinomyces denticolens]SHI63945.1 6-phosphogluconolactonase [Actinomyces denticolens]